MTGGTTFDAQIAALIASYDRLDSPFDRGLDRVAVGGSAIWGAIDAAANGELALAQLAGALARGRAELATARAMLALTDDEPQLAAYLAADEWFVDRICARLADPATDAAAIRREQQAFSDHQPVTAMAVAGTIDAAHKIRSVIARLRTGAAPDAAMRALLAEAHAGVQIARHHLTSADEPAGPRLAACLEAHAAPLGELIRALSPA